MTTAAAVRDNRGTSPAEHLNPVRMSANLWSYRELCWQFARRDVLQRYREARLGLLWAVLSPLALLGIYTFVFSVVFRARWGDSPEETRGEFALTLFCGMLLFNLFGEVVNRAPGMIVSNPNYVKKVVFPLETFVVSGLVSALVNMVIGYVVWLAGWVAIMRAPPHATLLWFPLIVLPVALLTMGIGWILSSLGAFLRDVGHAVQLGVQILFFATPIFYSLERVGQPFRRILELNPLTHAVEDVRRIMMYGQPPRWGWWTMSLVGSLLIAVLGYAFFMKSKRAFADVV